MLHLERGRARVYNVPIEWHLTSLSRERRSEMSFWGTVLAVLVALFIFAVCG